MRFSTTQHRQKSCLSMRAIYYPATIHGSVYVFDALARCTDLISTFYTVFDSQNGREDDKGRGVGYQSKGRQGNEGWPARWCSWRQVGHDADLYHVGRVHPPHRHQGVYVCR